jgi:hypothetical protein
MEVLCPLLMLNFEGKKALPPEDVDTLDINETVTISDGGTSKVTET